MAKKRKINRGFTNKALCLYTLVLLCLSPPAPCQETISQPQAGKDFFYSVSEAERYMKKGDYTRAISIYQEFVKKHDNCIAISHLRIAGIYQDHLGKYRKAMMNYKKVLSEKSDGKLTDLSKKVAGRWFERLRLNFLKNALKRYYVSEVEYPPTLRELSARGHIDKNYLVDSSGKSYVYKPRSSELSQKLRNQEYELYCQNLGKETKPLSTLIDEKKAVEGRFSLESLLTGTGGKVAIIRYQPVSASDKPEAKMVREGGGIGKAQIIEITDTGVILYWEDGILVLTVTRGVQI